MALPERYELPLKRARAVYYPTSDGKPMAETDKHRDQMVYEIEGMKIYFEKRPLVYVSGNNFLYYEEGNPKACISPDTYVVFGVGSHKRDSFKTWEEGGKLPSVVFEFTSKKTRVEDQKTKLPRYQNVLKIPEIFFFDPTGDYLKTHRLKGWRRMGERYIELELIDGRMHSEQLGLDLVVQGETLRLYDPVKKEFILSPLEQARRAEAESQRAEAESQRAEAESQRAEAESQRAENAEQRVQEVEAELEQLRQRLLELERETR